VIAGGAATDDDDIEFVAHDLIPGWRVSAR